MKESGGGGSGRGGGGVSWSRVLWSCFCVPPLPLRATPPQPPSATHNPTYKEHCFTPAEFRAPPNYVRIVLITWNERDSQKWLWGCGWLACSGSVVILSVYSSQANRHDVRNRNNAIMFSCGAARSLLGHCLLVRGEDGGGGGARGAVFFLFFRKKMAFIPPLLPASCFPSSFLPASLLS